MVEKCPIRLILQRKFVRLKAYNFFFDGFQWKETQKGERREAELGEVDPISVSESAEPECRTT